MTKTIMRIVGSTLGNPTPEDDTYLLAYDPNGNEGRGSIKTTKDKAKAKRFLDQVEALACWKRPSATHPWRLDGKPNRPLTAFTVQIINVED